MSTQPGKDVIYVDVDDEITALIDKVRSSKQNIVALVLPKRAVTLQSVVNMKLLKRTADSASKNLVLITTESTLLPLAGAIGVHVAKSLQSKPEIPSSGMALSDKEEDAEEAVDMRDAEPDKPLDKTKPIGEYVAPAAAAAAKEDEDGPIELDNSDEDAKEETSDKPAAKPTKPKKDLFCWRSVPHQTFELLAREVA